MDGQEYDEWKRFMRSRRGLWTIDPVHDGQHRDLIAFVPDRDDDSRGVYVSIDGPTIEAGRYEGGDPHVTKGMFIRKWGMSVLDGTRPGVGIRQGCEKPSPEAFRVAVERLGVRFLIEAICM